MLQTPRRWGICSMKSTRRSPFREETGFYGHLIRNENRSTFFKATPVPLATA